MASGKDQRIYLRTSAAQSSPSRKEALEKFPNSSNRSRKERPGIEPLGVEGPRLLHHSAPFSEATRIPAARLPAPGLQAKKYDDARNVWQARVNGGWRFYFRIESDIYIVESIRVALLGLACLGKEEKRRDEGKSRRRVGAVRWACGTG